MCNSVADRNRVPSHWVTAILGVGQKRGFLRWSSAAPAVLVSRFLPDINSRRPYQNYISLGEGDTVLPLGTIRYLDSYESGSYQALQVVAEKRYCNGLAF